MFNWFRKTSASPKEDLVVDIHSHLLPGLDDGVKTFEEAEKIIRAFQQAGYTKIITTPHVNQDLYRNTAEEILRLRDQVRLYLEERKIDVVFDAAAEYFLDEYFLRYLSSGGTVLTFGDRYLLFETNFLSEPLNLNEFIFVATTRGYKPVLAHPERYAYLQQNMDRVEDLLGRGVLFQINLNSLAGLYQKNVQALAAALIDKGYVHLLGSDCHNAYQASMLPKARKNRHYKKALMHGLLNNQLL